MKEEGAFTVLFKKEEGRREHVQRDMNGKEEESVNGKEEESVNGKEEESVNGKEEERA